MILCTEATVSEGGGDRVLGSFREGSKIFLYSTNEILLPYFSERPMPGDRDRDRDRLGYPMDELKGE